MEKCKLYERTIINTITLCRYAPFCAFISVIELPRIPAYYPKVRQTIKELGGTMPENLPTPAKSIKQIEREQKLIDK